MLRPILGALGTLIVIEALAYVERRFVKQLDQRWLLHLWAASLALFTGLRLRPEWDLEQPLPRLAVTLAVLASTLVLFGVVDVFALRRPWGSDHVPLMPSLVRDVARLLLLTAVGIWAASTIYGIALPTVLVSSTVLSAVVGLALQDVLKNVFAGMSMQLERQPRVNDWLLIDGQTAVVEEMSWRTTRLRTNEGVELLEPNAKLAERQLVVYGTGREPVAFAFRVGLGYAAPPARVKAALLAAARSAPGVESAPPPQVFLRDYQDFAILYELRAWTRQVAGLSRFRDAVSSRIWYELQREGLEIPFPIRTVHLHHSEQADAARAHGEAARARALFLGSELFGDLGDEVLDELASRAVRRHYDVGEHLMREGEEGDSLFVVDRGRVLVTKSGFDLGSSAVPLAALGPGSFLGEMSLLTGEHRSATVTAETGCEVLVLAREALAPLVATDPTIAEHLSHALTTRSAATVETFRERRERTTSRQGAHEDTQASLLARIRQFFRLPGN